MTNPLRTDTTRASIYNRAYAIASNRVNGAYLNASDRETVRNLCTDAIRDTLNFAADATDAPAAPPPALPLGLKDAKDIAERLRAIVRDEYGFEPFPKAGADHTGMIPLIKQLREASAVPSQIVAAKQARDAAGEAYRAAVRAAREAGDRLAEATAAVNKLDPDGNYPRFNAGHVDEDLDGVPF